MTDTKHTPGPWLIKQSRDGSGDVGITADGLGNVLAECFSCIRLHDEFANAEALANARLIASAPDMFDEITRLRAQSVALVEALEDANRALGVHCFTPVGHNTRAESDTCRICGFNVRSKYHLKMTEKDVASVRSDAGHKARAALAQAESDQ
jgi:hypothetical protein